MFHPGSRGGGYRCSILDQGWRISMFHPGSRVEDIDVPSWIKGLRILMVLRIVGFGCDGCVYHCGSWWFIHENADQDS
jgi:hypothetical protein